MYAGATYTFCSRRCLETFSRDPESYLGAAEASPKATEGGIYTCPMHPEIEQQEPGSCPTCGMALEPMAVTEEEDADPEPQDMTRRFWG